MELLTGEMLWPRRDGWPAVYPPLQAKARADVAVIGAGIGGALVAWHLARAGVDTIVLERHAVAQGSTAGSTCLLQYELDVPLHRLAQRIGRLAAEGCYRRCGEAVDGIVHLARTTGGAASRAARRASLYLASNDSHVPALRREFEARRAAGFEVEWWSRARLARESSLPQSAAIRSALGAQLDGYAFTHALLRDAARVGARVHERTAVTRVVGSPRGVTLQTSRGATVRARHLVVATGYEAAAWLPPRLVSLQSTYALASEPVADLAGWPTEEAMIWETKEPYVYLRTTDDRRVMIGGYDEPFADAQARDALLPAKRAALVRRFRQLLPQIPLEVNGVWAGTFARTPDGRPVIGRHPERNRVWLALGYGGNGITFSLIAAEMIRDGILGRKNADEAWFGWGGR